MYYSTDPVQRFLALSELYLKMTGKTPRDITSQELEEFLDTINDDAPLTSPEQYLA